MFKIQARNFPLTEAIREACQKNFLQATHGFPAHPLDKFKITLRQENAPHQPGPDSYVVTIEFSRWRIFLDEKHENLYGAIELAFDSLRRRIARRRDRSRHELRRERKRFWQQQVSGF
jgi:ribosome-associated translation inhibitor RaiA